MGGIEWTARVREKKDSKQANKQITNKLNVAPELEAKEKLKTKLESANPFGGDGGWWMVVGGGNRVFRVYAALGTRRLTPVTRARVKCLQLYMEPCPCRWPRRRDARHVLHYGWTGYSDNYWA